MSNSWNFNLIYICQRNVEVQSSGHTSATVGFFVLKRDERKNRIRRWDEQSRTEVVKLNPYFCSVNST